MIVLSFGIILYDIRNRVEKVVEICVRSFVLHSTFQKI